MAMKITCICLRRSLMRYQDAELRPRSVKRAEDHLLDCGHCRARLLQLRNGQRFARELPRLAPEPGNWESLETALDAALLRPTNETATRRTAFTNLRMRPVTVAPTLPPLFLALGLLA